jgi:pSer/pThr/pTyr-binding forkhead associated (FHA) protein
MWILESDDPTIDPLTFRLGPGAIKTIGRSPGAEFIVDAALVSRLHCQLTATAESLHVKDLGSTNGTFVNGKRVHAAQLKNGDRLGVGRLELIVSRSD